MNRLEAVVEQVERMGSLHLVSCRLGNQRLKMVSLELDELLEMGKIVKLTMKSTSITIAKKFIGEISYANQLKAKIIEINNGRLLSSVKLKVEGFILESLITREASFRMQLSMGDEVLVLIKESEISVMNSMSLILFEG